MINISGQMEKLQAASTSLTAKVEELSASMLSTDDDAITALKDKLKSALDALNEDIKELQNDASMANKNKKW